MEDRSPSSADIHNLFDSHESRSQTVGSLCVLSACAPSTDNLPRKNMTTNVTGRGAFAPKTNLPTFGNFGNTLLERRNPGIGRSTPDSEVLASSDEEAEQTRIRSLDARKGITGRRTSLLADQSIETRRTSFGGSNTGSQPNTPGTSQDAWSTISPGVAAFNGSAYPFGPNIWGSTRDPPSRLSEVRHDLEDRPFFPNTTQPHQLPHRSLSFSAGQKDSEAAKQKPEAFTKPAHTLQRRTSRQSSLAPEHGGLQIVNEDDSVYREIDAVNSSHLGRPIGRTASNVANTSTSSNFRSRMRHLAQDQSELAIDDSEEPAAQMRYPIRNAPTRRLSDLQSIAPSSRQPVGLPFSNTTLRNARGSVPQWSSNLDFDQLEAIPQSRRHSFADVPTRRGSLGSDDGHPTSFNIHQHGYPQENDPVYFNQNDVTRRLPDQEIQHQTRQDERAGLHNNSAMYGMPQNMAAYHGPARPPLYVVNFKCCRSDIFYIQEDSGLTVQPGDLVSVEADRGTDLGCVEHIGIGWDEARKFKAKYAEQHFRWLMMFSQQTRSGAPNMINPNALSPGRNGSGSSAHGLRDNITDIKPKMIKRHAHQHEVYGLQDKEGDEAKAKRICQSKVAEHGLNMEILDAEFQFDRKKLTFYFFSNEYINFNALVTELFKMYKTRIWMYAINPASFQSPVSAMGLTPIHPGSNLGMPAEAIAAGAYDDSSSTNGRYNTHAQLPQQSRNTYSGMYFAPVSSQYGHYSASFQPPSTDPFSNFVPQAGYGMSRNRPEVSSNMHPSGARAMRTPSATNLANQFSYMSFNPYTQHQN